MVAPAQVGFNHKLANRITAQIIPVILVGIIAYTTWFMIMLVSGQKSRAKDLGRLSLISVDSGSFHSTSSLAEAPQWSWDCNHRRILFLVTSHVNDIPSTDLHHYIESWLRSSGASMVRAARKTGKTI